MSFLASLFKRKKVIKNLNDIGNSKVTLEIYNLFKLQDDINGLLSSYVYISRKKFQQIKKLYAETIKYFTILSESKLLLKYCHDNHVDYDTVCHIMTCYNQLDGITEMHNDNFINSTLVSEKNYLDHILTDVDPKIMLDEEQRKVVLCDEDYSLVVAGAGAGKTTTVAAKVRYLVEKQNIKPDEILVISFTNKAVGELQQKINKDLHIDCPITTFHATGNTILNRESNAQLNIMDPSKLYYVLQDYFKNNILTNERMVNSLILFFASYFDAPYEGSDINTFFNKIAHDNNNSLKSDVELFEKKILDIRTKRHVTIQNEQLRSKEEVQIANFLFINGIEYEYEPIYKYNIMQAKKPYTPDFLIRQDGKSAYIEHFGITEDGKNNRYSDDELRTYKKNMNYKIDIHKRHGTILIQTFSKYCDKRSLIDHLAEELISKGFRFDKKDQKQILNKIVSTEENRYIRKLLALIVRFINNFKVNGFTKDDFNRMYLSTQNVRNRLFLDICFACYLEYEKYLKEHNAIDFQDMINKSAQLLEEAYKENIRLNYKYIIVDEYQDISKQRFDLVKALSKVSDAKVIAVGDDWQSIYAFSGSDITLFTQFRSKMGYAKILKIIKTYRNSQEIIDIAGSFIQKNSTQISKSLISPKQIKWPIIIYTYDDTKKELNAPTRSGSNYEMAKAVDRAIEQIIKFNAKERPNTKSKILLLGRYSYDGDKLEKSGLFAMINKSGKIRSVNYPNEDITFMTVHASKGLGYDDVIVLNCKNETYGFPSKIEDDPVLKFVTKDDQSIEYAEERRLFYVAMTRTKNRVFFIAPKQNPSEFLLEIKKDFPNIVLIGNWNEKPMQKKIVKKCPICGYPLQYRYKPSYGLKLFICTNDPEVCGFMTNEYNAGKLSILKCDQCQDGYLVAKKGPDNNFFLGCTNYKSDGQGCNNTLSAQQYYKMMNYSFDSTLVINNHLKGKVAANNGYQQLAVLNNVLTDYDISVACISGVYYHQYDLNQIIYHILCGLQQISKTKYYGIQLLIDVLRGAKSIKISKNQLDNISEYGKINFLSRDELEFIINWMIKNKLILKTKSLYPVLHPTNEGVNYGRFINKRDLLSLKQSLDSR